MVARVVTVNMLLMRRLKPDFGKKNIAASRSQGISVYRKVAELLKVGCILQITGNHGLDRA